MTIGRLDFYSDNIDWLPWGFKGNARIGEDDDAYGDEECSDSSFSVHRIDCLLEIRDGLFPAADEIDEDHDDRDDDQDVDEATDGVTADEA
jgi:hypothetical protein